MGDVDKNDQKRIMTAEGKHLVEYESSKTQGAHAERAKTRGETINTWTQTIGIILAGLWGLYIFVHQEILKPKYAPAHISANLELAKVGTKESMLAVQARLTLSNQSEQTRYLLPSMFVLYGTKADRANTTDDEFLNRLNKALKAKDDQVVALYTSRYKWKIVAAGPIFTGLYLQPKESTSKALVFFVPKKEYDVLRIKALFPTVTDETGITSEWIVGVAQELDLKLFNLQGNNGDQRVELKWDNKNDVNYLEKKGYARLDTSTMLALLP